MKKALIALSLVAVSAAASASTYNLNGTGSYVTFATAAGNPVVSNFNLTMNVNDTTKLANLSGAYVSGGATYNLNLNFVDPYTSGASQMWGYFSGSITGPNGFSRSVVDTQGGVARNGMDARLGINAGPYNSISNKFELGFWGNYADFNALATCTSATATSSGSCTPGTPPGGNVPLPGSLALLGLGALGLGFARKGAKAK
jgi:PEP-CTERM motif